MDDQYIQEEDPEDEINEDWWQLHEEPEQEEEEWNPTQQIEEDQQSIIEIDNPVPMETITLSPKRRGRKRSRDHGQTSESNVEENNTLPPRHPITDRVNLQVPTHDVHHNHLPNLNDMTPSILTQDHDVP